MTTKLTEEQLNIWYKKMGFKRTEKGELISNYSTTIYADENENKTIIIHPFPDSGLTEEDLKRIKESWESCH